MLILFSSNLSASIITKDPSCENRADICVCVCFTYRSFYRKKIVSVKIPFKKCKPENLY